MIREFVICIDSQDNRGYPVESWPPPYTEQLLFSLDEPGLFDHWEMSVHDIGV